MIDRFRPRLPFRIGDRVRTLSGQVGRIASIQSNMLTIVLDSGHIQDVSAFDAVLESAAAPVDID